MKVLFVCTGNTCRSAMAVSIARLVARERGGGCSEVEIASAGTAASLGSPASDGALLVGLERGTDLSAHRARPLTRELVEESDLLLAMAPHHLERIEELGGRGKSHLLTSFASRGAIDRPISDPFGGDLKLYRESFSELEGEIRKVFERLAAERSPGVS